MPLCLRLNALLRLNCCANGVPSNIHTQCIRWQSWASIAHGKAPACLSVREGHVLYHMASDLLAFSIATLVFSWERGLVWILAHALPPDPVHRNFPFYHIVRSTGFHWTALFQAFSWTTLASAAFLQCRWVRGRFLRVFLCKDSTRECTLFDSTLWAGDSRRMSRSSFTYKTLLWEALGS